MAYKNELRSYNLTPQQKAAMIMILDQFSPDMETVHEIKNILSVKGKVVIGSHYALLLARIIDPYYQDWATQLIVPLENCPAMSSEDYAARWKELVENLS